MCEKVENFLQVSSFVSWEGILDIKEGECEKIRINNDNLEFVRLNWNL